MLRVSRHSLQKARDRVGHPRMILLICWERVSGSVTQSCVPCDAYKHCKFNCTIQLGVADSRGHRLSIASQNQRRNLLSRVGYWDYKTELNARL